MARGAGTSLSGGALPDPRGVVLSLAKFRRILAIDPLTRTATVQPGVRNLAISEAAAAYGLYYAPDPSSQIACSIGGNVAENAGGVHCLKYGLTVHNVRRVRGVLITGEVVEFGGEALDSAGYDLLALITGSEGLLAVITEITVKLLPKPQLAQVALAAFADVEQAGAAVAAIIAAGIIPAGLEMMDQPATRAVEQFVHADYPLDAAAVLLVESDGTTEEVAAEMAEIRRVLTESGATEIRVSKDEAQRLLFWSGRKAAFPAVGRISPDYYCIDGTIPRGRAAARAARDRRVVEGVRPHVRQRVPRRRRQPASADPFRCQQSGRVAKGRSSSAIASCACASTSAARSPASMASASRSSRRCACSSRRRSSSASTRSSMRSTPTACSIPARPCRRSRAAANSASSTSTPGKCCIPTFRVSS